MKANNTICVVTWQLKVCPKKRSVWDYEVSPNSPILGSSNKQSLAITPFYIHAAIFQHSFIFSFAYLSSSPSSLAYICTSLYLVIIIIIVAHHHGCTRQLSSAPTRPLTTRYPLPVDRWPLLRPFTMAILAAPGTALHVYPDEYFGDCTDCVQTHRQHNVKTNFTTLTYLNLTSTSKLNLPQNFD